MLAEELDKLAEAKETAADPVRWMEARFYVPEPCDPSGETLEAGPIRLMPHQKAILHEAFAKDDGRYRYTLVIYSCPKKSGKTSVGAAVALYMAEAYPGSEVKCVANDGKQSEDRILGKIKTAVDLARRDGHFAGARSLAGKVILANGSVIDAIPVDPTGEAGSEPRCSIFSEMWGYRLQHKRRLFAELTVPPTLSGEAQQWVESYAGYSDEDSELERLYGLVVRPEYRFQLDGFPDIPVYRKDDIFCYWDSGPEAARMPWQTPDYYVSQAGKLTPNEFRRIHLNEWVTSTSSFLDDMALWDACEEKLPPLKPGDRTPIVVALDASESKDATAMVGVSRHPARHQAVAVRLVAVFDPGGQKIDYGKTLEPTLRRWARYFNIVQVCYDKYQLHFFVTNYNRAAGPGEMVGFSEFPQAGPREVADAQLWDLVVNRRLAHDGHPVLREHVQNAAKKAAGPEKKKVRMVKKAGGKPIDAGVCLSMASARCLVLNL